MSSFKRGVMMIGVLEGPVATRVVMRAHIQSPLT